MSLNDAHSFLVSVARMGRGLVATSRGNELQSPLELYEFESCPFCRKVREAMSELDLVYVSRTSGRGSAKREELVRRGGKAQFPYLVDPNAGIEMYESEDIIDYLHRRYGNGRARLFRWLAPFNTAGAAISGGIRPRGGRVRRPRDEQPAKRLVLYNFEASPYCRKVREALVALDLDCEVRNVAKWSARRPELVETGGKMLVPYLIDPNQHRSMYESDDIVAYLEATYG
ncbi:MAG: glutathione S-transferase N-terminal domain-containing protein [Myxococcota bacterium]